MTGFLEEIKIKKATQDSLSGLVSKTFKSKKQSIFSRFIKKIKETLFEPSLPSLHGRVQELHKNSDEILERLLSFKEEMRAQIDSELFKNVENALDPMVRDVRRIQKMMQTESSPLHHDRAYQKYSEWVEAALIWMALETKLDDKEAIIETVIKHTFVESDKLIDQDLQVILDYEFHILSNLAISTNERQELELTLKEKLSGYREALTILREKPATTELAAVTLWRNEIDRQRGHHFEKALHDIDEIIFNTSPLPLTTAEEEEA